MSECPALIDLEGEPSAAVRAHVGGCSSCRIVAELLSERRRGLDARAREAECAKFEMLIAARGEGTIGATAGQLLDAHMRECASCAAVAATMPPIDPQRGAALPAVSPAAYALGKEVARGGMGRILEANDLRIGRRVAVKELLGRAPALAARFEREARVTARLQHPGIVPIYEIGTWPDGTPFYAMRMVEGKTLRDAIRARRTLDERLALLPAVIAASEAVAFAHAQGIIHRDLTPNNVLVGAHGDTVVIDWGLAKDLSDTCEEVLETPYRDALASDHQLTSAGAVLGTAAYMPPEQANGESVDRRADVYALGAMLYHVLAGESPYKASASDDIVRQVRTGPPQPLREIVPGTPLDLASIVDKAMSREAASRYASARELADELQRFQTGRLVEAHHYSRGERARRWLRAHRASMLAGVAAAVGLALAGGVGLSQVLRERDRAEHERVIAENENVRLMEEQGRQELIAGNTTRALAWLNEAYKSGDTSPELRFMLGTAMGRVESIVKTFDCSGKVHSLEFSPDGAYAMAACEFGIGIARTSDWTVVQKIGVHSNGAVYSHNGKLIASKDGARLRLIDASTGQTLFTRQDHTAPIATVAFTADDTTIVTAGHDATVRIWDVATGEQRHVIDARSGEMNLVRASVSPDGKTVVAFTSDGLFRVLDISNGTQRSSFKIPVQPMASQHNAFSPDGKSILACATDGTIWVIETATGKQTLKFSGHAGVAFECAFNADGSQILSAGLDNTARVWDAHTGRLITTFVHGGLIPGASFSPGGERVATVGNGELKIWHAASGSLLASIDDPFGLDDVVVFSPDGRTILSVREPSTVVVYRDLGAGLRPIPLVEGEVALAASPDFRRLFITGAKGGPSRLVDSETMQTLYEGRIGRVEQAFAFSRDSRRLAVRGERGVLVLSSDDGRVIADVATSTPQMVALDANGRRLLVVFSDKSEVWDVDARKVVLAVDRHSDKDCLSPDGSVVLAWSDPKQVEVWSIDAQRVQATITLDNDTMGPIGFNATGSRVVMSQASSNSTSGGMPTLRLSLHDVATGQKLADMGRATAANLDVPRRFMVASSLDRRVAIWDIETGKLVHDVMPGSSRIFAGGEVLQDGALLASLDISTIAISSPYDGRLLSAIKPMWDPVFTQNTFQIWGAWTVMREDGRVVAELGTHPLLWSLPREERPSEEVDRIVRERVRWRVIDGRLMPQVAVLHGRVLHHGVPVAAAEVTVDAGGTPGGDSWLHVRADESGRFSIPTLPWGHYGTITMAPDHTAKGMHGITVDRDELTMDFDLDEEATISGEVVDDRGQAVQDAVVHQGELEAKTDSAGKFTLHAIGAGELELGIRGTKASTKVTVKSNTDAVTGVRIIVKR